MSRRNTISREFFATIAAVLVLGLSVMCAIQTALSAAYFIGERKSSLTDVLNGATALSERFADEGSIVTKPLQGEDVLERAHSGFELFNTASGALVFIADESGQILLHTGDDAFTGESWPSASPALSRTSARPHAAWAAGTLRPAHRWTAAWNWPTLRRPSIIWLRGCRPSTIPAGSLWATSPTSCARP